MRVAGWESALDRLLQSRACVPFAWGRNDCATFAADAVLTITGVDHLQSIRGRWCTARGAFRMLRHLGGMTAAVSELTGLERIAPPFARVGDLACYESDDDLALAVVIGGERLAAPGGTGLLYVEQRKAVSAWRV